MQVKYGSISIFNCTVDTDIFFRIVPFHTDPLNERKGARKRYIYMQEKIVIIYFYASLNSDAESNLNFLINISVIVFVLNISIHLFSLSI